MMRGERSLEVMQPGRFCAEEMFQQPKQDGVKNYNFKKRRKKTPLCVFVLLHPNEKVLSSLIFVKLLFFFLLFDYWGVFAMYHSCMAQGLKRPFRSFWRS